MYFRDPSHRALYYKMTSKLDSWQKNERHYSLIYLLSAIDEKVFGCIEDFGVRLNENRLNHYAKQLDESKQVLLELAYQLFTGHPLLQSYKTVRDIFGLMTKEDFKIALEAIQVRFSSKAIV